MAELGERFSGVRRIAVLRGGALGDLLFAVPAMRALAAAYPHAEITLLGSPVARELLRNRPGAPHRVCLLPAVPGVTVDAAATGDARAVARFVDEQRATDYDLAVQVHGGGRYTNPLLLRLGARHTVGTRTADAAPLERTLDYVYYQHEVLRALEVVGLAGAPPTALEPRIQVSAAERSFGARALAPTRPTVALHPGATDPRRRWPVERFARLCEHLLAEGTNVVLIAGRSDAGLCARISDLVATTGGEPTVAGRLMNLAGQLTLPELTGVLAASAVMVGNDSGPRHLAQAVGTATVSIYWIGNVITAGPLGRRRHRVHLGWTTHCPVCGRDSTQPGWTAERCAHDESFVAEVPVEPVLDDVRALLAEPATHSRAVTHRREG